MYQLSYLGHSISIGDVFNGNGNSAMVTGFRFKPGEFPRIELLRASGGRKILREFNELLTNAPTVPYGGVNVNEFTGRVSVNGEYAYSGYFTGAGVCYTCGVNCDCVSDELGTCDECNSEYDTSSRDGRCGNCGNCATCCVHAGSVGVFNTLSESE